jgi:hypothetical protein
MIGSNFIIVSGHTRNERGEKKNDRRKRSENKLMEYFGLNSHFYM